MKVLFLDIDGVLNRHGFDPVAQSSTFEPDQVAQLRRVLLATGAKLVVSSSWRYLVLGGAMTLRGFEYLLRTHGLPDGCVVGHTRADEEIPARAAQIRRWLEEHGPVEAWAVVDDGQMQFGEDDWRFVRTRSNVGLGAEEAQRLIDVLGR